MVVPLASGNLDKHLGSPRQLSHRPAPAKRPSKRAPLAKLSSQPSSQQQQQQKQQPVATPELLKVFKRRGVGGAEALKLEDQQRSPAPVSSPEKDRAPSTRRRLKEMRPPAQEMSTPMEGQQQSDFLGNVGSWFSGLLSSSEDTHARALNSTNGQRQGGINLEGGCE